MNLTYLFYFAQADLEQRINQLGLKTVLAAGVILLVCAAVASLTKKRHPKLKLPLFLCMAAALLASTAVLFGGTVYLNVKAESRGPVHWHTDIEFWACGVEMELRNPHGALSNKIGSATFHEHNDKRMHLEGVVVSKSYDASLEKFMQLAGGYISPGAISLPLNESSSEWFASAKNQDGDKQKTENIDDLTRGYIKSTAKHKYAEFKNGGVCGNTPASLQTFVYRFDETSKTYTQTKLANPAKYVMRDESVVPPGDCVIVEFDRTKSRTDKLCRQYGVRDSKRCMEFGVKEFTPELCNIREITVGGAE